MSNVLPRTTQCSERRLLPMLHPAMRFAADSDGAVLLNNESGKCFSLNTVGALIVNLLRREQSEEAIVSALSSRFPEVAPRTLRNDMELFIAALENCGILK